MSGGFSTVMDFAAALDSTGENWEGHFYKSAAPVPSAISYWVDTSMAAGTPKYNAYVGNQYEGTPLVGNANFGIYAGPPCAPKKKILARAGMNPFSATTATSNWTLADYVYFYPLIDGDSTDEQVLDSGAAALPRYTDGAGLRAMIVCTTPQTAVSPVQCIVKYISTDDDEHIAVFYMQAANVGQVNSLIAPTNGAAPTASVVYHCPFISTGHDELGIKAVLSVQLLSPVGGFFSIVMVKPILTTYVDAVSNMNEIDMLRDKTVLPVIADGAYLNWVMSGNANSSAGGFRGSLTFARGA